MSNPQGYNGITPTEPAYGERKRMGAAQRSAPLAGGQASASAQNTPRRSKNRAVRGTEQAAPVSSPAEVGVSPQAAVASFWQQAAQLPGFDPDLAWLAQSG